MLTEAGLEPVATVRREPAEEETLARAFVLVRKPLARSAVARTAARRAGSLHRP